MFIILEEDELPAVIEFWKSETARLARAEELLWTPRNRSPSSSSSSSPSASSDEEEFSAPPVHFRSTIRRERARVLRHPDLLYSSARRSAFRSEWQAQNAEADRQSELLVKSWVTTGPGKESSGNPILSIRCPFGAVCLPTNDIQDQKVSDRFHPLVEGNAISPAVERHFHFRSAGNTQVERQRDALLTGPLTNRWGGPGKSPRHLQLRSRGLSSPGMLGLWLIWTVHNFSGGRGEILQTLLTVA